MRPDRVGVPKEITEIAGEVNTAILVDDYTSSTTLPEEESLETEIAIIGGDYPMIQKSLNDDFRKSIDLTNRDTVHINCTALTDTGEDKVESINASDKLLSLLIPNFDFNNNVMHRRALEFVNILLLSTQSGEEPTLVAWDKLNYVVIDFSNKIYIDEATAKVRELSQTNTSRNPNSQFNPQLLQAADISEKTWEMLKLTVGEKFVKRDENAGYVVLDMRE